MFFAIRFARTCFIVAMLMLLYFTLILLFILLRHLLLPLDATAFICRCLLLLFAAIAAAMRCR